MLERADFERAWLDKFAHGVSEFAGEVEGNALLAGSESLSSFSSQQEIVEWTQQALACLDDMVDEETGRQILLRCACRYPRADLQEIRAAYQATQDLVLAHQLLQTLFESFMRSILSGRQDLVQEVIDRGWGVAGIRQGPTIVATKIPESGNLVAYFEESDPARRRQLYCHCPRVRDLVATGGTLSPTYCYCGAGFYRDIWEEIVQCPVRVEVLETVLQGGDVCRFAIHFT
jgi:hypothetical protein